MSLNDSKIRKLKPSSRPVKLSDSHGLYLLVNPGGSRIWYLKYRLDVYKRQATAYQCSIIFNEYITFSREF